MCFSSRALAKSMVSITVKNGWFYGKKKKKRCDLNFTCICIVEQGGKIWLNWMNQIPVLICALFLLMFFHNTSSCIFSLAALWWERRLALWSQGLFLALFEAFQLCHLRTESVMLAGELGWLMHLWAKLSLSWNWKSSGLFFLQTNWIVLTIMSCTCWFSLSSFHLLLV